MLRPVSGRPMNRPKDRPPREDCRGLQHINLHSLHYAGITNTLDAGVPFPDAQISAPHGDPRTTEHYDRPIANLHRDVLTAYVAGYEVGHYIARTRVA